jgi:dTDP-4-amino-4,6-dideoxygalactose transaminase
VIAKRGPAPVPAPRSEASAGRVRFGDLSRQIESLRAEIDAAAARVLDRGWFILGEEVEAFEREFAAHMGAAHAIGVASGTEAITLALAALGIGPGDEVITASATAVPTAAAVVQAGAAPVFADVDDSLTLDPVSVEAAIGPRTRAILPVHLYGQPADLGALGAIAKRRGLPIVEDASQAHDAAIGGRKAGTVGAIGCFSFYPSKNLGAFGDAGAVVTSDGALAARVRSLRTYGQARRDHAELPGINSRLDELQAAFLRVKLPRLEEWTKRREALAALYDADVGKIEGVRLPRIREGVRHVRHLYAIEAERRDALRAHLAERGIETLIHYPAPVHRQPAYAGARAAPGGLPRTDAWAAATLSLPLYPELREDEAARVAEAVCAFYEA